jgi:general secretion pathway protein G
MVRWRTNRERRQGEGGFTLVELIIVMTIIAVLASIAIPSYLRSVNRAKEAVLREDLHTMRTSISNFEVDEEKRPEGLDDLVQKGYLKAVPIDPITGRNDTWITGVSNMPTDIDESQGGIDEVHSGAQAQSSEGTSYNSW